MHGRNAFWLNLNVFYNENQCKSSKSTQINQENCYGGFEHFSKNTANATSGFCFRIDFLWDNSNALSGLLREDGIHGKPEASDHDSIDEVLLFFGALTDRLTGCPAASVTGTYTMYCNSLNLIHGHCSQPEWFDYEVSLLSEYSRKFKQQAYETFLRYQASTRALRSGTF